MTENTETVQSDTPQTEAVPEPKKPTKSETGSRAVKIPSQEKGLKYDVDSSGGVHMDHNQALDADDVAKSTRGQ